MSPTESGNTATTASSTAEEDLVRARGNGQSPHSSPVSEPRLSDRSLGAQRLEYANRLAEKLTDKMYQDPEQARLKLQGLDDAGRERLRNDPTELGPLRHGVEPSSVNTRGLSELSKTYKTVTTEDRHDLGEHHVQVDAFQKGKGSMAQSQQETSLEGQMNRSLVAAPAAPHYLSI